MGEGVITSPADRPRNQTFVVKALGLPEVDQGSICRELLGNILARELGIETPDPAVISISQHFAAAANPVLAQSGLKIAVGMAAGCEYIRGGLTSIPMEALLNAEEIEEATRLYAFDLSVQNPDRRREKPNCAFLGSRVIAFDFEAAFSFLFPILGPKTEAWEVSKHGIAPLHLFQARLKAKKATVQWAAATNKLGLIDDIRFKEVSSWVPEFWTQEAQNVLAHLASINAHLSELQLELQASLA
jgi:hypothetical protein